MDNTALNRAVAVARGWTSQTTTHGETWFDGTQFLVRLPDVCGSPAAWGALLEECKAHGYSVNLSMHRGRTTVKIVDMKAWYSGDAEDAETGRAVALAFLRVKRVLEEEA